MKHNFNAGPSILPKEVFEEASRSILDFNGTGLSILEIGHRTPLFEDVLNEAVALPFKGSRVNILSVPVSEERAAFTSLILGFPSNFFKS